MSEESDKKEGQRKVPVTQKTLMDEMAMAALPTLNGQPEAVAAEAYEIAFALMNEREKPIPE